jgi:hypothetical protein
MIGMTTVAELFAFHTLATAKIDPALTAVEAECSGRHSGYVFSVDPTASPARSRCLLTIRSGRIAERPTWWGSLEFADGNDGTVLVRQSFGFLGGRPEAIERIAWEDVDRSRIEQHGRKFVDELFARLAVAAV